MKKKIVITGALGYVGQELCRLYSGLSWHHEIIGIDNRFLSESIIRLKHWGIEFKQIDILSKKSLKEILADADVVFHLAGITDVAYVNKDINKEKEDLIKNVAIIGTQNIIDLIKSDCKLIFPSTHVVFEGLKKIKRNICEDEDPLPVLAYSKSKYENENQIKNQLNNYVIMRLGSLYGLSADSTRIKILPNLFSSITSQKGNIKLFAGGHQLKSLISVYDVARFMKFVEENNINKEIFHLVKESLSVKDLARICKKIDKNISIIISQEEVPNKGYTLSNKKLINTGFKFLYSLKDCLKEMIYNWKFEKKPKDLEYKSFGTDIYKDYRGIISNYHVPEKINLIGYIESNKGSVRANHYHPVQEQKCLLVKGQYISFSKNLIETGSPITTQIVNPGDMVTTKPNVAHAMVFTKDSILLNLVNGEREHKNYGITHTVPHEIVPKKIIDDLISGYKTDCRVCKKKNLERIISFGFLPFANNLSDKKNKKVQGYPLELNYCLDCYNCQLSFVVNPLKVFSNYLYLSSVSKDLKDHFDISAKHYIKKLSLSREKSIIIDVGSNDGVALDYFKKKGFKKILGIEPAKNLVSLANKKGINTIQGFFNRDVLKKIKSKADLILLSNVFAHIEDIDEIAKTLTELIKDNGTVVIEVQYLLNTLKDLSFDNIYHEHVNYWSVTTLVYFFKKFKFQIIDVQKIGTHGGSIRVYIKKGMSNKISNNVKKFLEQEKKFGINKMSTFIKFANSIESIKKNIRRNLFEVSKKFKNIYGYGAPAKASTNIKYFLIENYIKKIFDDNKLKSNKYLPDTNINITSDKSEIKINDLLLVFSWNYFNEIKKNNKHIVKNIYNIRELENKNFKI